MKATVLSEHLQKKLSLVNRAISPRAQLPILQNFLLSVENGTLTISATDLEMGIQTDTSVKEDVNGGVTVPAKVFTELINSLPSEKILLQLQDSSLFVQSKNTKSIFQTIPKDEFPKLYEEKGDEIALLRSSVLRKDFGLVVFAASIDVSRPSLSGVLINKEENGFLLVATDGYRLSLKHHVFLETSEKGKESLSMQLLVPARILREVMSIKPEEEDMIRIYVSKANNQVLFANNDTVVVGRLIEADYPVYQKIIPSDFATRVIFDREMLHKAVKICAIFARETANIVKLAIKKDGLTISANTPQLGQNFVDVEAKVEGEENEIAFNAKYLLDLFGNVSEETMVFEMTGPLNPGVFKIKDDDSFLHIIMPIRVQG